MFFFKNIFIILILIFIFISIFFTFTMKPHYIANNINENVEKFDIQIQQTSKPATTSAITTISSQGTSSEPLPSQSSSTSSFTSTSAEVSSANNVTLVTPVSKDIDIQIKSVIAEMDNTVKKNKEKYKNLKTDKDYEKAYQDFIDEFRPNIFAKYMDYVRDKNFHNAIETYSFKDKVKQILSGNTQITNEMTQDLIQNTAKLLDNNTLTDYRQGASFQKVIDYKMMFDKYDVQNNEALLTYMCVKTQLTSSDDMVDLQIMISKLSSVFYVSVIDTYIINSTDMFNKISDDIDDVIRKSGEIKIECPIYALIYQSPYLRYNGNEIKARYDVINNLQSSYDHIIDDSSGIPQFGMKSLYTKIIMMYPLYFNYNGSGKIVKYPDNSGLNFFQEYFNDAIMSRDKLCFLQCNQTNKLACGCLNRSSDTNSDTNYYKSTCLDEKNIPSNYGMMYSVNHKFPAFVSKIYLKETI